jgi:hypothetical protein
MDDIECGPPFQQFCREIAKQRRDTVVTLWGAVLAAFGHFYLITSAGAAATQCRTVVGTLKLFPSREEYMARFNVNNTNLNGTGVNGRGQDESSVTTERVKNTRYGRPGDVGEVYLGTPS